VLSVDEFLTLRREVLQLLKQYDQPTTVADDTVPGEEVEAPPGEEPDEQPLVVSSVAADFPSLFSRTRVVDSKKNNL
jgi:hypothetical protein